MNIYNEVYEKVAILACELANASASEITREYWSLYNSLESLCISSENSSQNHPFQWETLADFTTDDAVSIPIYNKAFELAKSQELSEYMASIKLALAERYSHLGLSEMTRSSATETDIYAKDCEDSELRVEISEFIQKITGGCILPEHN